MESSTCSKDGQTLSQAGHLGDDVVEFATFPMLLNLSRPRARDEAYPTPQSSTAAMSPIDRAASGEEDAEVTEVQQRSGDSLSFAWDLRWFGQFRTRCPRSTTTGPPPEVGQLLLSFFSPFFLTFCEGWFLPTWSRLYT